MGCRYIWKGKTYTEEEFKDFVSERMPLSEVAQFAGTESVPDAPFKTAWPMLAFKRALRWAVDNGYERVAWTTGEQQADRYDLSKHLRTVEYNSDEQHLLAYTHDDTGVPRIDQKAHEHELPEIIGKDAAEKILSTTPDTEGYASISGLDLKIGGEGMSAFYDRMLPNEIGKYVKQWGAKVGQTKIADVPGTDPEKYGATVHSVDVTDAMRTSVPRGQAIAQDRSAYNPANEQGEQGAGGGTQVGASGAVRRLDQRVQPVWRALGIAKEIEEKGHASLIGQKVEGDSLDQRAKKIAELAQVLRNPKYETFRYIFVKGDTIVHVTGVSSRLPDQVPQPWPVSMTDSEGLAWMHDQMGKAGADGYYLLHNHPSGDPTPSMADRKTTQWFDQNVEGFRGHVIIDSNRFAALDRKGNGGAHDADFGPDLLMTPAIPNSFLGTQIANEKAVANIGFVLKKPGWVVLIGTAGKSGVRAIMEVSGADFLNAKRQLELIREFQSASGSSRVFAYGEERDLRDGEAPRLIKDGWLFEAVTEDGRSFQEMGHHPGKDMFQGEKVDDRLGAVEQDNGTYEAARERVAAIGDGIKAALGKAGEAVHDALDLDGVPKLRRVGEDVGRAAVAHATAPDYVGPLVDNLLAKVTPRYNEPKFLERLATFLNENNRLGIYDDARNRAQRYENAAKQLRARAKGEQPAQRLRMVAQAIRLEQAAKESAAVAAAIERKVGDMAKLDRLVKGMYADPSIRSASDKWEQHVNPEMDRLYNNMKGLEPDTEQPQRGRYGKARMNLKPLDEEKARSGYGGLRAPSIKKDTFAQGATGLGVYDTNLREVMVHSFDRRLKESSKIDFIRALEDSGAGVLSKVGDDAPDEMNGEKAIRIVVDRWPVAETNDAGDTVTKLENRLLSVPESLHREIRDVLNTDLRAQPSLWARLLTGVQLMQLADATAHLANQATLILSTPGGKTLNAELTRKLGLGLHTLVTDFGRNLVQQLKDTPAARNKIARLFKIGAGRGRHPDEPTAAWNPLTWTGRALHASDTAVRMVLLERYDNLVRRGLKSDNDSDRRDFVNQLGNYNGRLMHGAQRTMRDMGISPFIVAGQTFNRNAARLLVGKTGGKAPDAKSEYIGRMVQLFGVAIAVAALPALLNYLLTGKLTGRAGVPFGAIDTGKDDDRGGHIYIDPLKWLGIRRGLRVTGIGKLIEGARYDGAGEALGGALWDIFSAAVHPWAGPPVSFMWIMSTGSSFGGYKVAGPEFSDRLHEALREMNQPIGALYDKLTDHEQAGKTFTQAAVTKPVTRMFGVGSGFSPAERLASELGAGHRTVMTPDQRTRYNNFRQLLDDYKTGALKDLDAVIDAAASRGIKLNRQQARQIESARATGGESSQNRMQGKLRALTGDEAMRVWDRMTPEERAANKDFLEAKVYRSKTMGDDAKAESWDKLEAR